MPRPVLLGTSEHPRVPGASYGAMLFFEAPNWDVTMVTMVTIDYGTYIYIYVVTIHLI